MTLHLDNETFQKAFTDGRRMDFDESEYDFPHVAHCMGTLDAVGSVLGEDGKGGYRPLICESSMSIKAYKSRIYANTATTEKLQWVLDRCRELYAEPCAKRR